MTKETQNSKSTAETSSIASSDPMAMFQSFMSKFSEAAGTGNNPAAGFLEMNQHWMNFLGERFKKDAALLQQLSKCTNPADMTAAHTEFYKEAVGAYQREFTEMAELGQQAIGQVTNNVQENTDRAQAKKS